MLSRKADGPMEVHIPRPGDDQPSWTRVGVIAAIGFIVGVAWPKLAGVRLGPSLPADATSATASAAPPGAPGAEPPSAAPAQGVPAAIATPSTAIAPSAPAAATPVAAMPSVSVAHGVVFACKTSDGDALKGGDCGTLPGLDGIVMPRLRKLAECADAAGESGKLHLVVHLDFPRGGIGVELGRGQGVSSPDALLACAKSDVAGASLAGISHDNPRYSVAYSVTLGAGGAEGATGTPAPPSTPAAAGPVDGEAQVVWEVAIIRDAPKTGKIVARLQRGTQLHVGAVRDGWYPVKYGDGFSGDGWVYRGAIGR